MARLRGQVETAEALEPVKSPLPLPDKALKTIEAMHAMGAPAADIEAFIKEQVA